jgi:hypothetical protein
VTSDGRGSVARCHYCGREIDERGFQVRLVGSRGVYDSTECAQAHAETQRPRAVRIRGAEPRPPLK